jgi:hypothetical protein
MSNYVFNTLIKHYGSPGIYEHEGSPDNEPIDFKPVGTALVLSAMFIYLVVSSLVNSSFVSPNCSLPC